MKKGGYEARKDAAEFAMKLAEMDGGGSNAFWDHLHRLHGYLDHGVRYMKISGQEKAGKEEEADREMRKGREEELRKVQQLDGLKPSDESKPVSGKGLSGKIDEIKKKYPEKYPDPDLSSKDDLAVENKATQVARQQLFLTPIVETVYNEDRTKVERRTFKDDRRIIRCRIDHSIKVIHVNIHQKKMIETSIMANSLLTNGLKGIHEDFIKTVKETVKSVFNEDVSDFTVTHFYKNIYD